MLSYTARKWLFIITIFSITCVATLLIIQFTINNNTSYETVEIISFQTRVEWLHISVVVLYTFTLISTTTKYIHWYFIPLGVFITIQLVYYTWLLLDRDTYIQEQLDLSWDTTYQNDQEMLNNIQDHWQCQGFKYLSDRPAFVDETMMRSCYPVLAKQFGPTIFVWGIGLWLIKLIQAIGLLASYILYIHTNTLETEMDSMIILSDDTILVVGSDEKPYIYNNQKQY
ncbi:hypothetical protein BD770DRAFT_382280 [Pilaira anomala]|nr:hypothetical protein BD770DRAFT_382280 [Pilaira anomala]